MPLSRADSLLTRWKAWDQMPGSRERVIAMETECRHVAAELGITANDLRGRLSAARRNGWDYEAALRLAMGGTATRDDPRPWDAPT